MKQVAFYSLIAHEMEEVEKCLAESIDTEVKTLGDASSHLLRAGGKRLRPAFLLLTGSLYRQDIDYLVPMAAAMELLHMATLVHDDVIDNSCLRRGFSTVKAEYGNRMSVYAGDYSFARALYLASTYNNARVVNILAESSMRICEGEIDQMKEAFDTSRGLKSYLRRIQRKTALLIAVSCEIGALLAGASPEQVNWARTYGYYLGMAFQVTDDILDFTADPAVLGKMTGSDLRQGIITLPVLYALRYSPQGQKLKQLLDARAVDDESLAVMLSIVLRSGGIEYARECAASYVLKSKKVTLRLPDRPARQVLYQAADFILERDY